MAHVMRQWTITVYLMGLTSGGVVEHVVMTVEEENIPEAIATLYRVYAHIIMSLNIVRTEKL